MFCVHDHVTYSNQRYVLTVFDVLKLYFTKLLHFTKYIEENQNYMYIFLIYTTYILLSSYESKVYTGWFKIVI